MIVTLTTDFGLSDGYVGAMKGALLSLAPRAVIVDLCHTVPPGDIQSAAFLLYQATPVFPPDSIHVVVVDPDVGSIGRQALAARTTWGTYVAPDNGLLTLVLSATETQEMVSLTGLNLLAIPMGATFHGRDIFAPVAAHLVGGLALSNGSSVADPIRWSVPVPEFQSSDSIVAHVLHIDHFGNLVLDIQADQLPPHPVFEVAGHTIRGLSRTYADGVAGQLIAYVGSTHDHVEIALPRGHAARFSDAAVGMPVLIRNEGT